MLRKMKINKYFLGIVLIIIIIMYFMAGVLFLGNTREDNNMKVSTEQQEIAYQTFKSETEGYSLASKYAEADLYDKLTKLTADDIQEVVNAIDN